MNSWIIYKDKKDERLDFSTDASLRRYCMSKGALQGWRKLDSGTHKGFLTCVYPTESMFSNLRIEDDGGE